MQPRPNPTTPSTGEPSRSGWGLAWLALLPVACCGLPLLLTAIAAVGTGAAIGGGVGLTLLAVAGGVTAVAIRLRRACPPRAAATKPGNQ